MTMTRKLLAGTAAIGMFAAGGCVTDPQTGEREISTPGAIGGVAGAIGGYLLGDLIGGRNDRTERIDRKSVV